MKRYNLLSREYVRIVEELRSLDAAIRRMDKQKEEEEKNNSEPSIRT